MLTLLAIVRVIYVILWLLSMYGTNYAQTGWEPQVDLLTHTCVPKNIGSYVDGYGMCVTSSMQGLINNQCIDGWEGLEFREYAARNRLGGGASPSKVVQLVNGYAKEKRLEPLKYVSVEGPATEELIRAALKSGRGVAATDGGDIGFYRRYVPHMTNINHFTDTEVGIVDNNRLIQEKITYVDWTKRHESHGRWAMILLDVPSLPVPHNFKRVRADVQYNGSSKYGMFQDCPGGNCSVLTNEQPLDYYWIYNDDGTCRLTNRTGTATYGVYDHKTKRFMVDNKDSSLPVAVPQVQPNQLASIQNNTPRFYESGVDVNGLTKLTNGQSYTTINGKPVSFQSVLSEIQDSNIKDTDKPSVVIRGKKHLQMWEDLANKDSIIKDIANHCKLYKVDTPSKEKIADAHGYWNGITVLTSTVDGHATQTGYFKDETKIDKKKLVGAYQKADPHYRPDVDLEPVHTTDYSSGLIVLAVIVFCAFVIPKREQPKHGMGE